MARVGSLATCVEQLIARNFKGASICLTLELNGSNAFEVPDDISPPKLPKRHMRLNHAAKFQTLYGQTWTREADPLTIEIECIKAGGRWICKSTGKEAGLGLEYHYKAMDRLLWPEDVWDEWDTKIDRQLIKGGVQGLAGASSSGKTYRCAKFALRLYWVYPNKSTILCSTTTLTDLENRIWGAIKELYLKARARYPELPGFLTDSSQRIKTDSGEEEGVDFRNGIKGLAGKSGSRWIGLGPYVGVKNHYVALLADEGHLMPPGYFDVVANLSSNPWWLVAASGNPNDPTNSFGQLCEPKVGWDLLEQGDGDQVWESRSGEVLRLDGLASPNLAPGPGKEPCQRKITHRYIEYVRKTYGEGSWQWEMWVRARFLLNIMEKRLFVRKFAERYHAFDDPMWSDGPLTNLFVIDAAYGSVGGDRCVGGHFRFGLCTDGKIRLALRDGPILIPVKAGGDVLPEIQIVLWTKDYCQRNDIVAAHVGLDSTGRGSLVSAFSQYWSPDIVAIEFGGSPTDRPDPQQPKRTAKDGYVKFVSEMAFALRACIQSDQFRGITLDIVLEAEQRAWKDTGKPSKQEIEKKEETKERIKRSPDLLDMTVCGVELARRLGFSIESASPTRTVSVEASSAIRKAAEEWQELNEEAALEYA